MLTTTEEFGVQIWVIRREQHRRRRRPGLAIARESYRLTDLRHLNDRLIEVDLR